jgi:hypothetical protein
MAYISDLKINFFKKFPFLVILKNENNFGKSKNIRKFPRVPETPIKAYKIIIKCPKFRKSKKY